MLYLIDNPVVREAFFPSGTQPLAVEPARPDDLGVIQSISRRHDGPDAAAVLESWWATAPETFSVVRDRDGEVAGFFTLLQGRMLRRSYVADDPVLEDWVRHLREHPLPNGQLALGLRRWLDAERGELPCASQAACWLDVKRTYMALRPALRRMYVVVRDVPTYWPIVEKLGFRPLPDPVSQLGGADYTSVCLDFGPKSVDGWLSTLVDAELGIGDGGELDEQARELSMHGQRVPLSRWSSACSGIYAIARARPSADQNSWTKCGGRSSRAAAMSSTPSCDHFDTSSAPTPRSWRPCAPAAIGCARIGAPG
jgi:hypothetical protein